MVGLSRFTPLVQDIKTGLPDPINLVPPFIPFENDIMGDWNDKDMEEQVEQDAKAVAGVFGLDFNKTGTFTIGEKQGELILKKKNKPSLLTKLKNRFKK